ncbi:MAG: hypothetical protein ACP5UA_04980 [Candidatus Hydrogenedens sp.]
MSAIKYRPNAKTTLQMRTMIKESKEPMTALSKMSKRIIKIF